MKGLSGVAKLGLLIAIVKAPFSRSFFSLHSFGGTPESLLNDLETLGFLFEALCERDLSIYAASFGGRLCHYQDYKNKEIDAIIERPDGQWAAFEIKLGANQIRRSSCQFAGNTATNKGRPQRQTTCSFMCTLRFKQSRLPPSRWRFCGANNSALSLN